MLTFRCEHCEQDFDTEPDGTGYEQAPCPSCGYLCVTVELIEQDRQRNRPTIPQFTSCIPQFTLRTLLLAVTIAAVFLSLSVVFRSYYCAAAFDGYRYGFPFHAVAIRTFRVVPSVSIRPLFDDVLVYLLVVAVVSRAVSWVTSRMAVRRTGADTP